MSTPERDAIEAVYAAWHGAGVDLAGGNWERFVGMLPTITLATKPAEVPSNTAEALANACKTAVMKFGVSMGNPDNGPLERHYSEVMRAIDQLAAMAGPDPSLVTAVGMTNAARDVLAERARQISVEGWTPEHDDRHGHLELASAASCYANEIFWHVVGAWPWEGGPKFKGHRSNYVRAGALIQAAIECIDRSNQLTSNHEHTWT